MINVKLKKFDKNKFYPIDDRLNPKDLQNLGLRPLDISVNGGLRNGRLEPTRHGKNKKIMARMTGKKRCPKRGEWFLSGAIIEAYRAPNDLNQQYHIAELVIVEKTIVVREVG